jgi:nucleotide-binding universal stress UspA family protein
MDTNHRLLIAIDHSDVSHQAVNYVAEMIGGRREFHVDLLHVLPPYPPNLLEHGGSEDPDIEEQIEAEMRDKQGEWLEQAKHDAQPMLDQAKTILREARVPARAISTHFYAPVGGENLVSDILLAAQNHQCDTIVVGRETFSGLQRVLKHHVADDLIRRALHHTIWVVE